MNWKRWTSEEDEVLRTSIAAGASFAELARRIGCKDTSVALRAKKIGLASRQAVIRRANAEGLNIHYFDEWSPSVAYDLGYIWADGCVYWSEDGSRAFHGKRCLKLHCVTKDESIILGIRERLGSCHTISRLPGGIDARGFLVQPNTIVAINGGWVEVLIEKHGILPRKTYLDCPFPVNIPDEHLCHFVRGFFDGDGSVCRSICKTKTRPKYVFNFLGTPAFMSGLIERLVEKAGLGLPHVTERNDKEVLQHSALWVAQREVYRMRQFLYPEGSYPFLARKRELFDRFVVEFPDVTANCYGVQLRKRKSRYCPAA